MDWEPLKEPFDTFCASMARLLDVFDGWVDICINLGLEYQHINQPLLSTLTPFSVKKRETYY